MNHTDLIGSAEACRILGRDKATLSRWIGDGRLTPVHQLPGKNGAYVFRRADVDTLAQQEAS